MIRRFFLNTIVVMSMVFSMVAAAAAGAVPFPGFTQALAGSPSGVAPAAGTSQSQETQALPPTMPVFAIQPTLVNHDIILRNAGMLNGVGATNVITFTTPSGLNHFFAFNPDTGNIVDQFNRTGGLFAINYGRAYSETEMSVSPTLVEICLFLANRNLFPMNEVEPQYTDCRNNPPYIVKQIHLATETPATGGSTNTVIGELVQVPLAINIGMAAPNYIPMGGPGGHLSLLLAGTPTTPSLDDTLPGLQGLASPWFGRMRLMTPIGTYPVVPAALAIERFKAQFPAGMQVNAGTPVMVYYMDFPDAPQDAIMPTWTFPNATAIISGTVASLKDSPLPGVDGFAPNVNILSPADGTIIMKDQPVSMTFSITGDQGPFTYTISADSNVVTTGVTVSGTLTLNLGVLPPMDGRPEGHMLSVHAINTYNIAGDAAVFLGAVKSVYLPVLVKGGSLLNGSAQPGSQTTTSSSVNTPDSLLRIGVEWVMDYHNPKSNLSQTKPDAEGLYNWLGVMGWGRAFNYGNDSAWERDWRDCTLGGADCTYGVDRAEFVYFSGHGSPASFYFGVNLDWGGAWGGNARFQNVRWAGFSSCQTLRAGPYVGPGNPPLTNWFNSFQGAYMLLGFHSVMGDIPFGFNFGFNMSNPVYTLFPWLQPSIREAWVNTAFNMNAGKPAYLYAVGNFDPVNFKLPPAGSGPLPPLTGIYQFRWVWWDE